MAETEKSRKMQSRRLLSVLAAVCILALAGMGYTLTVTGQKNGGQAAFVPPPFETEAREGEPEVTEELVKLGYGSLDVKDYQISVCGAPELEGGRAILYLTNPETNRVWLKVRILDAAGRVLGESGLLRPGEYTESVELDMEAVNAAWTALGDARGGAADSALEAAVAGVTETAADSAPDTAADGLPVTLRLMAYEPETYHSAGAATLNTTLAVGGGQYGSGAESLSDERKGEHQQ